MRESSIYCCCNHLAFEYFCSLWYVMSCDFTTIHNNLIRFLTALFAAQKHPAGTASIPTVIPHPSPAAIKWGAQPTFPRELRTEQKEVLIQFFTA